MPDKYYSFLLRMWKTNSGKPAGWRIMLEDPHTHKVRAFDNLEAFFDFLMELTLKHEPTEQNENSFE